MPSARGAAMKGRDPNENEARLRFWHRTAARVALAVLVTALLPTGAMLWLGRSVIRRVSAAAFQPEVGLALERSLEVYADLAKSLKQSMRAEASLMAASPELREGASRRERARLEAELDAMLREHSALAGARVETEAGEVLASRDRREPVAPGALRTLTVTRPLASPRASSAGEDLAGEGALLVATFATPAARFEELESAQATVQAYRALARDHREELLDDAYYRAFSVLVCATIALAALCGILVARPVTRRIERLAAATAPVARGDLSVRVPEQGEDELARLSRAFNRMLAELERSRARIEFLRRVGEWQKVARRLAHEIKNPLTPIQLAVEECHRRYPGDDPEYQRILQTTLEVVEEEVGSLRRLVSEFSGFARLPSAELEPGDLSAFLREQRARLAATETGAEGDLFRGVDVAFEIEGEAMPASFDAEMLHRALGNLLRNAAEAIAESGQKKGRIVLRARAEGEAYVITVEDSGPGIPEALSGALFEPYATSRREGTGLGLAIVKKILLDHGGTIEAGRSPALGGASLRVVLPRHPEERAS